MLKRLPTACLDSVVTDPPYELGFMGKKWDASGIAYNVELWREVLRALKPGGHLLAFGGTRTYHRMACAIEDAGFEVRDSIDWIYGSGFPKSLDVSKAIDKAEGAERIPTGTEGRPIGSATTLNGWGTALKPAHEPIIVARKPLVGTVAANVLKHGTGALNIDGTRIGAGAKRWETPRGGIWRTDREAKAKLVDNDLGRWPANIVFDEDAAAELDKQAGDSGDGDGVSRFFYVAKASREEREAGLDHLPVTTAAERTGRSAGSAGLVMENEDGSDKANPYAGNSSGDAVRNHHPTVKPIALMRWLCRLVTPKGGLVLDPFNGSGTTGCAARLEGFRYLGFELDEDYVTIARARIAHWDMKNEESKPGYGVVPAEAFF